MMLLCLDVGNSHIFGGVFEKDKLRFSFRYPSSQVNTSDQIGVFLTGLFRENGLSASEVSAIAICSVVPHLNYSLRAACVKYLKKEPFILKAGVRTGLRVVASNPHEIGADRIANSIGAIHLFPNKNIIVIDFGTATTFCAITSRCHYLGGPILPGLRIAMESLSRHAAMLSSVNIVTVSKCLGQTTAGNVQSGIYFGQLGALREITQRLGEEAFPDEKNAPILVGTGGFAYLFEGEKLFTTIVPDLVLHGLRVAFIKNADFVKDVSR